MQYFALLGVLLLILPMKPEPIDWKPVINAGARAVRKVVDLADGATYFLSSAFDGGTYTAGYSSLGETGGAIAESGRTELILHTSDKPYFTYTDAESSTKMQVRRTLYLVGGHGTDTGQLTNAHSAGTGQQVGDSWQTGAAPTPSSWFAFSAFCMRAAWITHMQQSFPVSPKSGWNMPISILLTRSRRLVLSCSFLKRKVAALERTAMTVTAKKVPPPPAIGKDTPSMPNIWISITEVPI